MGTIFGLFVVLSVIGILAKILLTQKRLDDPGSLSNSSAPWPYYAKRPLSAAEQILYFRLTKALPDHIVLAQVQLSRMLGVKKGNNYQSWLNRINRMSADFVVCAKDSSVLAVIELDDATHDDPKRQEADSKKDKALGDAGIKIHRWKAKTIPDEATIKATLLPRPVDHAIAPAAA